MKIEPQKRPTMSEYTMHCALCGATSQLAMYPQRLAGSPNMCGWVFVCQSCSSGRNMSDITVAVGIPDPIPIRMSDS